jgi:hypothetical protein
LWTTIDSKYAVNTDRSADYHLAGDVSGALSRHRHLMAVWDYAVTVREVSAADRRTVETLGWHAEAGPDAVVLRSSIEPPQVHRLIDRLESLGLELVGIARAAETPNRS